jgi:predicted DNA-binding antitoxin AbrB/MazE fold protein
MYQVLKATYQDGVLKPAEDLPLEEQQQVVVIVLPVRSEISPTKSDPERVTTIKEQAATWLTQQPADAVRPPAGLEPAQEQRMDEDIEKILASIRAKAGQLSAKEIAVDIGQALAEIQMIPADEQTRLEAELDALLTK